MIALVLLILVILPAIVFPRPEAHTVSPTLNAPFASDACITLIIFCCALTTSIILLIS